MEQTLYNDFSMFHIFDSSAIQRELCFVSVTTHLVFSSRFAADLCSLIRVSLRVKIRTLDNVMLYAHCPSCVAYLSDYTIPYCFKLFATRIAYYAHVDIEFNSLLHSYIILPNLSNLLQGMCRLLTSYLQRLSVANFVHRGRRIADLRIYLGWIQSPKKHVLCPALTNVL